jgi:hypothetical protein
MYEFMEDDKSLKCPFGEYLQLMKDLIKEVGDVKHLINCGAIKNKLCTFKCGITCKIIYSWAVVQTNTETWF